MMDPVKAIVVIFPKQAGSGADPILREEPAWH
jgi:hypothetical protein